MNRFFHGISAAACLTLFLACSGSTTDTTSGDGGDGTGTDGGSVDAPMSTAATACADSVAARCQRNDACTNGFLNKARYGDEATCEARLKAQCVTFAGATGTGTTPASIEACAQALPNTSCVDFLGDNPPAVCLPQAGSIANGAACAAGAQCQSTYCATPQNTACGACAPAPKAGDTCATTADCGARGDLTCANNNTCVVTGAANAACGRDQPCGAGLSCVGAKGMTLGTCQAAGNIVGAACDPKRQTAPGCDNNLGLFCATSGQCAAETFAAAGQACGQVNGGDVRCSAGAVCVVSMMGMQDAGASDGGAPPPIVGTCLAPAPEGGVCDLAAGPGCLAPARCIVAGGIDAGTSGTCTLVDPATCK